jgi:hypothetical protein
MEIANGIQLWDATFGLIATGVGGIGVASAFFKRDRRSISAFFQGLIEHEPDIGPRILARLECDDDFAALFRRSVEGLLDHSFEEKVRAFQKLVRRGVSLGDDAAIHTLLLIQKAITGLDVPHVRILQYIGEGPSGEGQGRGTTIDMLKLGVAGAPGVHEALVSVLVSLGLVYDCGSGVFGYSPLKAPFAITGLGLEVLVYLIDEKDVSNSQEL